ncbi:MAG: hypothetical protein GC164_02625 [Phycisphaera sp.]|nr:hypothetical protein [Phycisphaera sp.]
MASRDEILKAARSLGDLIAKDSTVQKLEAAAKALQGDIEAQRVMTDYERQIGKIGEKEATGKPIEVADKRELERLQKAMMASKVLRDFQVAQMDYLDLMRSVDEAIEGQAVSAPSAGGGQPGR